MEIRPASTQDLPEIIDLFGISLGDAGGVPSEEFWRWKHHENPFGVSPTLLMVDGSKLVGLRTFMYWGWRWRGRTWRSLRCVDTATHPDYRGRGIFKKLTLELLDRVQSEQLADFIFNTPNAMSKPGYLKMGWTVAGKTPLLLKPHPLQLLSGDEKASGFFRNFALDGPEFAALLEKEPDTDQNILTTDRSINYFQWRYARVPGIEYGWWADDPREPSVALFYRVKRTRNLRELRLLDVVGDAVNNRSAMMKGIASLAHRHGTGVTTILRPHTWSGLTPLRLGFFPLTSKGLEITRKAVGQSEIYEQLDPAADWEVSAGAIELF